MNQTCISNPIVLNKNKFILYSTHSIWILECYNSETLSSYIHIAPLMYSTLHVFPWKYFLIRMQWRMNLEISSARNRLHDLNIPYNLSSSNCLSEVYELHEIEFIFWVMEAHRNSKSLQAQWKLRTNIPPPTTHKGPPPPGPRRGCGGGGARW